MRILYLHRTQGEEPESIHINAIVNALRDLGHAVTVLGPRKARMKKISHPRGLSGIKGWIPVFLFELAQILYNAVTYPRILREIDRLHPDLLYERYALYHWAGGAAAKRRGIPHILEVNTPYATAWAQYYKIYFPKLARRIERGILSRADALIAVTHALKQFLAREGHPPGKIAVTHNAIDPSRFRPDLDDTEIRREIGWKPGRTIVGFVGTMNRWQGIPMLREVIARVTSKNPDITFLMVGDGEFRKPLQEELVSLGLQNVVYFTGRKPHDAIPRYIRVFDIALVPHSNTYGSPMKVFEYFAMGKAVVAPRLGPLEEIVREEETGVLFPPGEPEALAGEILRLADSPELRKRLGVGARDHVLTHHVWGRNAEGILALYDKIIRTSG